MFNLLFAVFFISSVYSADSPNVAKVIILKGQVEELRLGLNPIRLKKGDWVKEGSLLRAGDRSFVKLLFIDKSQMNLGANSEVNIMEFPKNKAGIINLIKGKVRSKVTKNYMDIDESGSKLFIKTKTAAMGVRGTDFQVIYNPRNSVTSLVTFEGTVAMTKIDSALKESQINQRMLEANLNRKEAVLVRQGQYSGSLPNQSRVSEPVKISPSQLESLKNLDPSVSDSGEEKRKPASVETKTKIVRSIVPKGLDPKKVAEVNSGTLEKALTDGVGAKATVKVVENTQTRIETTRSAGPPPEGFIDRATGAFAPPAGGFVDEKTGLYVPPSEGSSFDPNAGVYIPAPDVGSVDSETGAYVPPEGFKLVDSGDIVPVEGRSLASVGDGTTLTKLDGVVNVLKSGSLEGENNLIGSEVGTNNETDALAQDFQLESTQDFNNPDLKNATSGRSQVEFRISR